MLRYTVKWGTFFSLNVSKSKMEFQNSKKKFHFLLNRIFARKYRQKIGGIREVRREISQNTTVSLKDFWNMPKKFVWITMGDTPLVRTPFSHSNWTDYQNFWYPPCIFIAEASLRAKKTQLFKFAWELAFYGLVFARVSLFHFTACCYIRLSERKKRPSRAVGERQPILPSHAL